MEIIEKKGKKYFEIEDIETFFKLNEYPKSGNKYPILKELIKTFQSKMDNSSARDNVS